MVWPGSTALTFQPGSASAHWVVTMSSAAFDEGYTRLTIVDSRRSGSVVTVNEPMPLDTITTRGSSARRSRGRKARVTRTGPSRLTPKQARKSAGPVSSGGVVEPMTPALLTSTSRWSVHPARLR